MGVRVSQRQVRLRFTWYGNLSAQIILTLYEIVPRIFPLHAIVLVHDCLISIAAGRMAAKELGDPQITICVAPALLQE